GVSSICWSSSPTRHHLRRPARCLTLYQWRDWYLLRSLVPISSSLGTPGQELVSGPCVNHSAGVQSQFLGALAPVDLELELSRRVGIGVDGKQTPHLDGHLQEPGRRVASLRTAMYLNMHI